MGPKAAHPNPHSPARQAPSLESQILHSFQGDIEPVRTSTKYRIATVFVAAAMLLLPAIYLGLIVLLAGGLYWYIIHNFSSTFAADVDASHSHLGIYAYLIPILVGFTLLLFLIKPIFARSSAKMSRLLLERHEERLIYEFVEQLCRKVQAPAPRRIYVTFEINASASFESGLIGWFTGKPVLTLGMPLLVNLSLREITCILAHEMGHFSQGWAVRLGAIVRLTNRWFYRVVAERDNWDRQLYRLSHRRIGLLRLVALISVLLVKGVRRILWLLLMAGHAMSAFLSRQMEFDADRLAGRVVGADGFEACNKRMDPLQLAFQTALKDLNVAWRERRLADDLPLYIGNRAAALSPEAREKISSVISNRKTRWYDTHPSMSQRTANVRSDGAQGIITIDPPARTLLHDPKELSLMVTIQFYQKLFGKFLKPEHLYQTQEIVQVHDARRDQLGAAKRYFQNLLDPLRPIFPEQGLEIPADRERRRKAILAARVQLGKCAADAQKAVTIYSQGDAKLSAVAIGQSLREADVTFKPEALGMARADHAEFLEIKKRSMATIQEAQKTIEPLLRQQVRRLQFALARNASAQRPVVPSISEEEAEELELKEEHLTFEQSIDAAMRTLTESADAVKRLRERYIALNAIIPLVRKEGNPPQLIRTVIHTAKRTHETLMEVHIVLRTATYPYKHTVDQATVSQFCCPRLPDQKNIGLIHIAARVTLNAVGELYMRLMADMAEREKVEAAMGCPPLPLETGT